jgi:glycosyltransferase involved in cell wall biosynthesis
VFTTARARGVWRGPAAEVLLGVVRIALVTTSYPAGEGDPCGHFVRAEARDLARAGHDVVVVAPAPGGAFGWPGVAARIRERPARVAHAAWWVLGARRRVAQLEVERIVAHWAVPCAWPVAVPSSVRARAELEVVSHGGDIRCLVAMPPALREHIARAIASRAIAWRFVSEPLKERFCAALSDAVRDRVERVACVRAAAIELPDVREAAERIARELRGARVAVSVGRLVPSKRVARAIEHVARARDVDALVVLGDGPERARLEAHARALGVDARFLGTMPRETALAWMRAAHVLLFAAPPELEGASTVLREAEAMGTPVQILD